VLILKRLFVSIGLVGTLYMLIGSQLYPYWYFQLIWLRKGLEFSYWSGGFNYLVFEEPYYLIAGAIGAFLLALKLYNIREKFLPFVDRHWLWLCLGSIIAIGSIAILNIQNNYKTYTALKELENIGPSISEAGKSLKFRNAIPNPPIDFEYLDADTVERMYSQIGPDLVEQKRTTESTDSKDAKASIEAGSAKIEGGIEQSKKALTEQERIKFSAERKCYELMRYAADQGSLHNYSDRGDWTGARIWSDLERDIAKNHELLKPDSPITLKSLEQLREEPIPTTPAEIKKHDDEVTKKWNTALESELTDIKGAVLVRGLFTARIGPNNSLILTHVFQTKPRTVFFETSAFTSKRFSELTGPKKPNLYVFGTVINPLDKAGKITIHPVAVF
jgi:hypothetical protein